MNRELTKIIKDIENAIEQAFEKNSYFSLSPSNVFDCVAKNIYKLNKIEPDVTNETFYPLLKGEAFHLLLEEKLSLDNYKTQKEIKIPIKISDNIILNGKIDLIVQKPEFSYIVDYKFISRNAFYQITDTPRYKDEGQINLYIHGYNQNFPDSPVFGAMLIYIMDEDIANKKVFFVSPQQHFIETAKNNINLIQKNELVRTVPPENCDICEYKNKCTLLPVNIPKTKEEIKLLDDEAETIRDAYEKYKMAEQYLDNIKKTITEKYKEYKKIYGQGIIINYIEPNQKQVVNYEKLLEEVEIPEEIIKKFTETKTKSGYYTLKVK